MESFNEREVDSGIERTAFIKGFGKSTAERTPRVQEDKVQGKHGPYPVQNSAQ